MGDLLPKFIRELTTHVKNLKTALADKRTDKVPLAFAGGQMVNKDINDEKRWNAFVQKLCIQTQDKTIVWSDQNGSARRERAIGPIFAAQILDGKYVAVYRYAFDYYTDEDSFDVVEDIAIELVDEKCNRLWKLPNVTLRSKLMDLVEYEKADADGTLNEFLSDG